MIVMAHMLIDYIFDPACPWCFIGKRRLDMALAMRPGLTPKISRRPFLLNQDIPPEGIDRTAHLIRTFGGEARARRVHDAVFEIGQSLGIDFNFAEIRRLPNSMNAHRLIRFAERRGKAEEMIEAVFTGYFTDAVDIGDIGVLTGIGENIGLSGSALGSYLKSDEDVDFIHEENIRVHRLGVNGVPSFIFNENAVISGAQEPRVLARVMDAAAAAANSID